MTNPKSINRQLFDIATILTCGGIILYYLGWLYWKEYFQALSIDSSYIDIPFEKIIATTWLTLVSVTLFFWMAFDHLIYNNNNKESIAVLDMLYVLLIPIGVAMLITEKNNNWYYYLAAVVVGFIVITFIQRKWGKTLGSISKFRFTVLLSIFIFSFASFFYSRKGRKDAESLLSSYEENVEVKLENELILGKFITYMDGKYFILVEKQNCERNLLVIENYEVSKVQFVNAIKHAR